MTEISEAHKRQSKRTAAAAVAVVAVLSLAFIGLVSFLDNAAGQVQTDSVSIEAVSSSEPFYTLLIGSDSRKGTALYTGKKTDHAQVDQHADVRRSCALIRKPTPSRLSASLETRCFRAHR